MIFDVFDEEPSISFDKIFIGLIVLFILLVSCWTGSYFWSLEEHRCGEKAKLLQVTNWKYNGECVMQTPDGSWVTTGN